MLWQPLCQSGSVQPGVAHRRPSGVDSGLYMPARRRIHSDPPSYTKQRFEWIRHMYGHAGYKGKVEAHMVGEAEAQTHLEAHVMKALTDS